MDPALKGEPNWTLGTLKAFFDLRNDMQAKIDAERDRRYAEVRAAEAMALRIKEQADRDAAALERENRSYKDEKMNQLREQISAERALYARKEDITTLGDKLELALRPINDYIAGTRGTNKGRMSVAGPLWGILVAVVTALIIAAALAFARPSPVVPVLPVTPTIGKGP